MQIVIITETIAGRVTAIPYSVVSLQAWEGMTDHSLKQTFSNLDIQGCGTNVKIHRRAGRMVYGGD